MSDIFKAGGARNSARMIGAKILHHRRRVFLTLSAGILCTACQTYVYSSKPVKMHLSPILCADVETEGDLRVWTKRNASWLKKRLSGTGPFERSEILALEAINSRLEGQFFAGCKANFQAAKSRNGFIMDMPVTPLISSELSFIEKRGTRSLCFEVLGPVPYMRPGEQIELERSFGPLVGKSCVSIE